MSGNMTLIGALERIASGLGDGSVNISVPELPRTAFSSWREEVIIVYCVGKGTFSADTKFINLQMDMFDLNGHWVGYQLGVHESQSTPQQLLAVPPFADPWTQPPVPHPSTQEWTKGLWTFADGSEVYATGPAQSHLVPFQDGSFLFMVTTGQTITNGSGRYEGCHGTKQATGSAFVPAGLIQSGKFPAPNMQFDAKTIEVFRIAKRKDLGPDTLSIDGQGAQRPAAKKS